MSMLRDTKRWFTRMETPYKDRVLLRNMTQQDKSVCDAKLASHAEKLSGQCERPALPLASLPGCPFMSHVLTTGIS